MLTQANSTDMALATTAGPPRNNSSGTDPLHHLPEAARLKLRSMLDADEELHASLSDLSERIAEAREAVGRAQRRLRELTVAPIGGSALNIVALDHPSAVQAQAQLDSAQAQVQRLVDRQALLRSRQSKAAGNCLRYAERLPHAPAKEPTGRFVDGREISEFLTTEVAEHTEPVRVPKGWTLDRARERIEELREEAEALEDRPKHSHVIRDMLEKQVRTMAARGEPDVLRSMELGTPLRFPTSTVRNTLHGHTQLPNGTHPVMVALVQEVPDLLPLWLFFEQDRVVQWINERIEHFADDSRALTDAERTAELVRVATERLAVERIEEELVMLAGAARRDRADARAVLSLSSELPAPG